MKYVANQELHVLLHRFEKGEIVPEELVTSRMKELCLVSPVHDDQIVQTEQTDQIDQIKKVKKVKI